MIAIAPVSYGWSQEEPVIGYYDPVNDWFVFEWDRAEYGEVTTIYDPPHKVKPIIKAVVTFDSDTKDYTYTYEVTNKEGAIQSIYKIFINHFVPIYDAKAPLPQEDWYMDKYKDKEAWHWVKISGTDNGIPSGQIESGFSFKSKGLPDVVNSSFTGYKRVRYSAPGNNDSSEIMGSFDKVFSELETQYKDKFEYVILKTIGPTAPPRVFIPINFIEVINNYVNESVTLGWLINTALIIALQADIDAIRSFIEANDPSSAKTALSHFMTLLDEASSSQRTAEAYGLLFYNAKYLFDKLHDTYIPPPQLSNTDGLPPVIVPL